MNSNEKKETGVKELRAPISFNSRTHKLNHNPTAVQGGLFVPLEYSEMNLHKVDSSELALQVDITFVGHVVIRLAILGFTICGCHGNVKNDRHPKDISRFLLWTNEQQLDVLAP